MTNEQKIFLAELEKCLGNVSMALQRTKMKRADYKDWYNGSPEFKDAVKEVKEVQKDFVEGKLLERINQGDTTAIIFYCKTQLKARGYTEKVQPEALPVPETEVEPKLDAAKFKKRVENKKTYLVKLLKQQGIYSSEMSSQTVIAAQLIVKTEQLYEEIISEGHHPVTITYSREGNPREAISAKEKLYLDYAEKTQKAIKALGMNTDSKNRQMEDADAFSEFMNRMREEDD